MEQIAFSFDKVTLKKIFKGFLISLTGGAALGALDFISTSVDFGNTILAITVASLVPPAVNAVREWMKGVKKIK